MYWKDQIKLYLKIHYESLRFCEFLSVWPDWAIYWTLGNFIKPLAAINLPKSNTFLGNYWKGVNIYNFSCDFWANFYRNLGFLSGHTDYCIQFLLNRSLAGAVDRVHSWTTKMLGLVVKEGGSWMRCHQSPTFFKIGQPHLFSFF